MATKRIKEETQPVPRKVRGTLECQGGDVYTFKPQGSGEATQQNVVTRGEAKMYDTVGKKPCKVVHLKVKGDSADVCAELHRQLDDLTHGLATKPEQPPQETARVVCLLRGKQVRMYIDEEQRLLRIYHEIPVMAGTSYASELMKAMTECNQTLTLNRQNLAKLERKEAGA